MVDSIVYQDSIKKYLVRFESFGITDKKIQEFLGDYYGSDYYFPVVIHWDANEPISFSGIESWEEVNPPYNRRSTIYKLDVR